VVTVYARAIVPHESNADRRGHRLPSTLEAIAERDRLLRETADRFCAGMSNRQSAAFIHTALRAMRLAAGVAPASIPSTHMRPAYSRRHCGRSCDVAITS
jgi:hypothetical protein